MFTRTLTRQRGTTLLETMVATAITGVLTAAAIPPMSDAMTKQRLRAVSSELFATFNLARSEAARRGSAVAVVPADSQDWSTGWKVFADRNDNGALDADEETIVERAPPVRGLTILPHFGATYPGRVLSYGAEGRLHRPGGQGLVIGRLVLSQDGAERSLCFASLGVRMTTSPTCD